MIKMQNIFSDWKILCLDLLFIWIKNICYVFSHDQSPYNDDFDLKPAVNEPNRSIHTPHPNIYSYSPPL